MVASDRSGRETPPGCNDRPPGRRAAAVLEPLIGDVAISFPTNTTPSRLRIIKNGPYIAYLCSWLGVKTAVRAIRDIRDAPNHVGTLRKEVLDFEELVENAQEVLQRENIPSGVLRKAEAEINDAEETIKKLNRKLESVQKAGTRRISGLRTDPPINHLMNHIIRHPQIQELIVQMDRVMDGRAELVSLDPPESNDDRLSSPLVTTELSTSCLSRRACRDDCRCKCYTKAAYRWPELLRPVVDDTFVNFVGQPTIIRRCSRRGCRKAKLWSGELSYVFPSWLLKKMISVSMISYGFKRTFHMKSVNVVSEFSDVVRYTFMGNLAGLQMLFSKRLAMPDDTPHDGWTLLHNAAYYGNLHVAKFLLD